MIYVSTSIQGDTKRTHCKTPPYSHCGKILFCDQCDYSTATKKSLVVHTMTHTGEKPFSCRLCDYKTSTSSNVTSLMLTHTGAKPFACSECDYKTAYNGNLTVHIRKHTNGKPYACAKCDFRTAHQGGIQHCCSHEKGSYQREAVWLRVLFL